MLVSKILKGMLLALLMVFTNSLSSAAEQETKFEHKPTAEYMFEYDINQVLIVIGSYKGCAELTELMKSAKGKEKEGYFLLQNSLLYVRRHAGNHLLQQFLSQLSGKGTKFNQVLVWKVQVTKDLKWITMRTFDEKRKVIFSAYFKVKIIDKENVEIGKTYIWDYRK